MENRSNIGWAILVLAVGMTCFSIIKTRRATIMDMIESRSLTDVVEATMGSTDFGYAVMDDRGQVRLWNNALEIMSGYSKSEMLNKNYNELPMIPQDKQRNHANGYTQAMSDPSKVGRAITIYCKMIPKHGDPFPIRIVARIIITQDGKKYSTANIEKLSDLDIIDRQSDPIPKVEHEIADKKPK